MVTAEDIIQSKRQKLICVNTENTLYDAMKLMVDNRIGEITVTYNNKIVGIWSERDLLRDLLKTDLDIRKELVGDYMMPIIYTAPSTATLNELQTRFKGLYIRHLYIEKNGKVIGLITSDDTIKAGFNSRTQELEDLTSSIGMEYYENWKHSPGLNSI